jgi:hypothetical protein
LSTTPTKITMNPRYKGYKEIFWLHFNWLVNYFFFIELYWSDWWNICTFLCITRKSNTIYWQKRCTHSKYNGDM